METKPWLVKAIFTVAWLFLLQGGGEAKHLQIAIPDKNGDYMYRDAVDDWWGTGVVSDRWEERRDGHVRGAYSLLQPDGQVRSVDYEVGDTKGPKSGFKAVVRYWPGPQKLLSSMSLSDSLANHAEPIVNTRAMSGQDYDSGQEIRKKLSARLFAPLRAELGLARRQLRSAAAAASTPAKKTRRAPERYAAALAR